MSKNTFWIWIKQKLEKSDRELHRELQSHCQNYPQHQKQIKEYDEFIREQIPIQCMSCNESMKFEQIKNEMQRDYERCLGNVGKLQGQLKSEDNNGDLPEYKISYLLIRLYYEQEKCSLIYDFFLKKLDFALKELKFAGQQDRGIPKQLSEAGLSKKQVSKNKKKLEKNRKKQFKLMENLIYEVPHNVQLQINGISSKIKTLSDEFYKILHNITERKIDYPSDSKQPSSQKIESSNRSFGFTEIGEMNEEQFKKIIKNNKKVVTRQRRQSDI